MTTQILVAQNIDNADLLFKKKHFSSASKIYLDSENKSQEVLEKLGDCYYYTSDMKNAAIWYKTLIDKHYEDNTIESIYLFRYYHALKGINNFDEADKWLNIYNDIDIEHIVPSENLNTKKYFKILNTSIGRPFTVHSLSINTKGSDFGVSIHGDKALFASTRKGIHIYKWNNLPFLNLYEATIDEDGELVDPTKLNSTINTKNHEANGIITKDGQTLYFSSNQHLGKKKGTDKNNVLHLNIYKASLVDGDWANVVELPFNNRKYSMMHPALNFDETKLYFSSDMPGSVGSFDIFYVDINKNGTFGVPNNVGEKINTPHREQFPYISSKNILYFSSDGHFGMGGLDIFKSDKVDGTYQTPINLSDIINSCRDDFAFVIDEENDFGYFSSNRPGGVGDDDIYRLTRGKLQIITSSIYFGFAKWNIREDTAEKLDEIISTLNKNPDMSIEIGAHTDARGSAEYNMDLSHKRANSVREYFIENGISDLRVLSKGYGESQPLNNCAKKGNCTEKDYSINRRCEFVILNQ